MDGRLIKLSMNLEEVQANWEKYGEQDPLWGILAWPDKDDNRWDSESFFQTGVEEIAEVLAYVRGLHVQIDAQSALDFGCGVGRLSQALAAHFQQVHGVDISSSMLELAAHYNQYSDRCQYHLNTAKDLSLFANNTFDFVYSNITLQHMPPRYAESYILELLRVLKPNGILMFQIPSAPKRRARKFIQPLRPTRAWRAYQKLRYGDLPTMDMYGIKRDKILRLLVSNGGHVLDVQADDNADTQWESYRYCVTKASND